MSKNTKAICNLTSLTVLFLSAYSVSAHADYSFNFDGAASGTSANHLSVNPYPDVSFLSGYLAADLDASGNEILDRETNQLIPDMAHWDTYADSDIRVRNPEYYNRGIAPSFTNALDAIYDQVFIKFNTVLNLTSFSAQLDNSQYGSYDASFIFVDAFGKELSTTGFSSYANPGKVITSGAVSGVSGVILSSGKLYDNIRITTVVPEPEAYVMLLAGLGVIGAISRFRKNQII